MDEYAFDGDGLGVETDNPMESTAFDYIPSGDSPYGEGALTETDASPYALDYNGPETHDPGMGPGMVQTDYGAHPWGTGAGGGYRPMSQARTDDQPLGSTEAQRRLSVQQPSNAAIDPETIYDRQSYEYASGDVIGAGIFDMPEGVTWNANDGVFANQYAMPGYMAREPMMYPSPSAMIDTQTGLPTIVQPSASGVQLSMDAPPGTPVYSPFRQMTSVTNRTPVPRVPYSQTPRGMSGLGSAPASSSAAESFGREAAVALIRRSAMMKTPQREQFVQRAMAMLGPQRSQAAVAAIRRLMSMGYPSTHVVEQVFAHCVMHAVVTEMGHVARTGRAVPPAQSVVRAATEVAAQAGPAPALTQAAQRVVPALTNPAAARAELEAFNAAPASGEVRSTLGAHSLDGIAGLGDPGSDKGMGTGTKVAIGLGVAAAGFAAWKYRDKLFGGKR